MPRFFFLGDKGEFEGFVVVCLDYEFDKTATVKGFAKRVGAFVDSERYLLACDDSVIF